MRWVALTVTLLLWAATWPQILPPEADLPPCHMMVLILPAGIWTVYEFVKARQEKDLASRYGHCGYKLTVNATGVCPQCGMAKCCQRYGYNLTGNVFGVCPECGEPT